MARLLQLAKDAVQAVGDAFTVTLPDNVLTEEEVKAGFVTKADHEKLTGTVGERITTAVGNAVKGAREEAAKDDKWLGQVAKDRKDFFAPLFPGGKEVDLEKIRDQFRTEEVTPLKTQLDTLGGEVKALRSQAVEGSLEGSLSDAGVLDNMRELIRDHMRLRVQYSPEHGRAVVFQMGEKGPEVVTKADKGTLRPITPKEYLDGLRAAGKNDNWFKAQGAGGGGFNAPAGGEGNLAEQIKAAEAKGDFGLAGQLKAKQLQGMQAR